MGKKSTISGLYRDGRRLVIQEGARFPHTCAICNKSGDEELVDFTFSRDKAHVVEAAAVQGTLRAVNDLATGARYTGPVSAEIPLCGWCRGRRLRTFLIGAGLLVLAVGYLVIRKAFGGVILPPGELGFLDMSLPVFISFGAILTGFVFVLMTAFDSSKLWFKATSYFDRFVWVSGAGKEFLAELPKYANEHKKSLGRGSSSGSYHRAGVSEDFLSAEELIRRANLDEDDDEEDEDE